MKLSLISMKVLYRLVSSSIVLCGLLFSAGCTKQSGAYDRSGDAISGLNMGQPPAMLTRAVELSQLRPIVAMNGLVVDPERMADGSWMVDYTLFDSSLDIGITWVENFNDRDLVLATYSNSFGEITNNSSFTIPVDDYITAHDADNDGVTNLQERVLDTDPYTSPVPNADTQGVWLTECRENDDGRFERDSLAFGPTSYQLSVIVYIDSPDCQSDFFLSINIIGTYAVSGEVSVLSDGTTAKHVDIDIINGTVTASAATHELLASQGTSVQEIFTEQGVENINDVSLDFFPVPEEIFTIYRVVGDQYFGGAELGFLDGSTAQRRHPILAETSNFRKQ